MIPTSVIENIKTAINQSPRNFYVAELHLQVIKYADLFEEVTGKEFCEALGIGESFGTEFSKMRKIAPRLKGAHLDVSKL
mgnify:CR=1 FL=1